MLNVGLLIIFNLQVKLLNYFRNYMKEHLLKAGANMEVFSGKNVKRRNS